MTDDPGAAQAIAAALQVALCGAFLASLLPKLRHPRRFAITVAGFDVVPRSAAALVAGLVILGEATLVLTFASGQAITLGVVVGACLLLAFTLATAINLRRGREIDCGCFGASTEKISRRSLVRLAAFAAAMGAFAALIAISSAVPLEFPWAGQTWVDGAYLVEIGGIAIGLVILASWILDMPKLWSLVRP